MGCRPGAMTRIAARRWLVPDLDRVDRPPARHFRLLHRPGRAHHRRVAYGARSCAHIRAVPSSIWCSPHRGHHRRHFVAAHGPLPWTIVVAVNDLAAKAEDLETRLTPFTQVDDDVTGAPALAPDPATTLGVPFVFVEEAPDTAHSPPSTYGAAGGSTSRTMETVDAMPSVSEMVAWTWPLPVRPSQLRPSRESHSPDRLAHDVDRHVCVDPTDAPLHGRVPLRWRCRRRRRAGRPAVDALRR